MSIQYMVLGFEPMTFWTRVSSHNHLFRALAQIGIRVTCFLNGFWLATFWRSPKCKKRTRQTKVFKGSGCGSVGRVVGCDSRDPWFDSSHQQKNLRGTNIHCQLVEMTKIKKREAGKVYSFCNCLPLVKSILFFTLKIFLEELFSGKS